MYNAFVDRNGSLVFSMAVGTVEELELLAEMAEAEGCVLSSDYWPEYEKK